MSAPSRTNRARIRPVPAAGARRARGAHLPGAGEAHARDKEEKMQLQRGGGEQRIENCRLGRSGEARPNHDPALERAQRQHAAARAFSTAAAVGAGAPHIAQRTLVVAAEPGPWHWADGPDAADDMGTDDHL